MLSVLTRPLTSLTLFRMWIMLLCIATAADGFRIQSTLNFARSAQWTRKLQSFPARQFSSMRFLFPATMAVDLAQTRGVLRSFWKGHNDVPTLMDGLVLGTPKGALEFSSTLTAKPEDSLTRRAEVHSYCERLGLGAKELWLWQPTPGIYCSSSSPIVPRHCAWRSGDEGC